MRGKVLFALSLIFGASLYAVPLVVASTQEVREKALALSFVRVRNVDTANNCLRLQYRYAQAADEPISMEAERATVIRFIPDKGVLGTAPGASSGFFIAYVDHIEFRFTVKTAGVYTAWYRARFPWKGNWNHTENMDDGETHVLTDSRGETLNQWIWTKGPTYDLSGGSHSWKFTPAGWCGGSQLDKVVLTRNASTPPTGFGPALTPAASAGTGEVYTSVVYRRNLVGWKKLVIENSSGKGAVTVYCSTDQGASWNRLSQDGDLTSIAPDKSLVFKVVLTADKDGASPFVTRAAVVYAVKSLPDLLLENKRVRLRFSGENGALLGIENKRTGAAYVVPGVETPLFAFMVVRGEYGPLKEIGFAQAELKKVARPSKGVMLLDYDMMGGGLLVSLRITLEPMGLVRFAMRVTNRTPYNIARVKFPLLRGLRIGSDASDDFLCTPILSGGIAKHPAALKFPRLVYTDRPLTYPGQATMCWMDLWDEKGGGLYLASEDKGYHVTELTFSTETTERETPASATAAPLPPTGGGYIPAPTPGRYINLGFTKSLLISRASGTVQVPDVVIGVHEGDWHWGADRYREWAQQWMRKQPVPDWFRDMDGWTDIHMIHLGAFVDMAKGRPHGNRIITMQHPPFPLFACWAQMASCEAHWSTPVLHRLLGTEEAFSAGVQKQHEMGHRMIFYVLPPRINPVFHRGGKRIGCIPLSMIPRDEIPHEGFYPEVGLRNINGSLMNPDGVYSEAGCCLGAVKWREYLNHIVLDKYIRQYGADGMYLDGIGLVTYHCANLRHGHSGYGEWSEGLDQWLSHLKKEAGRIRPGAVFAGEGMNDVDHRFLDVGLFYMDNAPQVYRYTFPENIGIVHGAPVKHYKDFPMDGGWLEFATVFGLKLGGVGFCLDKDPRYFRRVVAFRKKFNQFQSRARFVDEQGLSIGDTGIRAKLYVRDEAGTRGALVVFYNGDHTSGAMASVARSRVGALKFAWAIPLEGDPTPLSVEARNDVYRFTIPRDRLSAVLLLEKCEPLIQVKPVSPVPPGEEGRVRVAVSNLGSRPVQARLSLELPEGWRSRPQGIRLATGETRAFDMTFRVPEGTRYDVYDIYAVTRERDRTTRRCVPVGVCHPIYVEIHYTTPETVRVEMRNVSAHTISGTVDLVTPGSVGVDKEATPFSAPAGGAAEVVFRMSNIEAVRTREQIKAVVRYGKETSFAYELLQPPVLNGGFEQCVAGDGFPDYWNYRSPESLYLKGAALDSRDPAEGKQCLRIDPYENATSNFVATTLIRLVPDTRYRISVRIKRSVNHPGIGIRFFSLYFKNRRSVVDVNIGHKTAGPVNVWERFEAEFTSAPIVVPYEILLLNSTRGAATVWFDDVRIEAVTR